jgi:LacI family transcriptional regulator
MSKITLSLIAKTLGISVATASKALKDYPDISAKTKKEVKDLAAKLKYKPNSFAQSLRNQESKIIGLIIPEIVHHFFSNIILGVIKAAEKNGYLVITLQSDESYENEKKQIELLLDKNVDGILMSLAEDTISFKHINAIIDQGIPVVLFDKISKLVKCNQVVINDKKAAFEATKYLIDSGCKKIAHVRGPLKPQTTIHRFLGYKEALEVHGLVYDKSLVFEAEHLSFEDGKKVAEEILSTNRDIDGIFAFTDLLATGLLVKFNEAGVKIPEEVSIIGFSNWFLSQITSPTLSTVDQPGFEIGSEAFKLLFDEITDNKNKIKTIFKTVEVPTKIIIRNSTR